MTDNWKEQTCGDCRFWVKEPTDPNNLRQLKGKCREGPPNITTLPIAGQPLTGPHLTLCNYPILPNDWKACSRFERVPLTVLNERTVNHDR